MLQIKNTLGGGKPEGLYAWKKYSYAFTEKSTSGMVANTFITTEAQNNSIKYYYSSSYSYDDNTGMFMLENPTSDIIPYEAGVSPPANVYITVFSPSSEIMIKTSSTSGKSTLYNVSSGVYFHIANANYPYTLFESETILSFLDYIVSDKETAYPDDGVKGGYWYEKVREGLTPEMFGCTKMAVDTYTLAANKMMGDVTLYHSLGEIPRLVIIVSDNMDSYEQGTYRETIKICFIINWTGSSKSNFNCNAIKSYDGANSSSAATNANVTLSSSYIRGNTNYAPGVNYLYGGDKYTIYTFA